MVVALSGRRIDAPGTEPPVFPLAASDWVRTELRALFQARHAKTLVCSAACGADLIALEEAGALGMRRRIILPFALGTFRETSVVDRPGYWGPLFDQVIAEVHACADLVDLGIASEPDSSYRKAGEAILEEAAFLAARGAEEVLAVLVWNQVSRGEGDVTHAFGKAARDRGWCVLEVRTLPGEPLLGAGGV